MIAAIHLEVTTATQLPDELFIRWPTQKNARFTYGIAKDPHRCYVLVVVLVHPCCDSISVASLWHSGGLLQMALQQHMSTCMSYV